MTVAALACQRSAPPAEPASNHTNVAHVGPFVFTGTLSTASAGDTVFVSVATRNASRDSATMSYGACALTVRVYRPGLTRTTPVWDQNGGSGPGGRICAMYEAILTLQPGQSKSAGRELMARIPARTILGDTLPAGSYAVTATISFNRDTAHFELGNVSLRR